MIADLTFTKSQIKSFRDLTKNQLIELCKNIIEKGSIEKTDSFFEDGDKFISFNVSLGGTNFAIENVCYQGKTPPFEYMKESPTASNDVCKFLVQEIKKDIDDMWDEIEDLADDEPYGNNYFRFLRLLTLDI